MFFLPASAPSLRPPRHPIRALPKQQESHQQLPFRVADPVPSRGFDLDDALEAIGAAGKGHVGQMTQLSDNDGDSRAAAAIETMSEARGFSDLAGKDEHAEHTLATNTASLSLGENPHDLDAADDCSAEPSEVLVEDTIDDSYSDIDAETAVKPQRQSPLKNPATQHLFEQPATISLEGTSVVRRLFSPKQRPKSPAWEATDGSHQAVVPDPQLLPQDLEDSLDEENLSDVLDNDDSPPRHTGTGRTGANGDDEDTTPVGSDREEEDSHQKIARRVPTPYHSTASKRFEFPPAAVEGADKSTVTFAGENLHQLDNTTPVPPASSPDTLLSPTETSAASVTGTALAEWTGVRTQPVAAAPTALPTWSAASRSAATAANIKSITPAAASALQSPSVLSYAGEASAAPVKTRQHRSASLSSLQPMMQYSDSQTRLDRQPAGSSSHDPRPRGILKNPQKRTGRPPSAGRAALHEHVSRMQRAHSDGQLVGKRNIHFLDHDIILNDMQKQSPPPVHQGLPTSAARHTDHRYGRVHPPAFYPRNSYMSAAQRAKPPVKPSAKDGGSSRDAVVLARPYDAAYITKPLSIPSSETPRTSVPTPRAPEKQTATAGAAAGVTSASLASSSRAHHTPAPRTRFKDQPDSAQAASIDPRLNAVRQILSTARHDQPPAENDRQRAAPASAQFPPHVRIRKPPIPTSSGSEHMAVSGSASFHREPMSTTSSSSASVRPQQVQFLLQLNQPGSSSRSSVAAQPSSASSRPQRTYGKPLPASSGSESYSRMLERYSTGSSAEVATASASHACSRGPAQSSAARRSAVSTSDSLPVEPNSKG